MKWRSPVAVGAVMGLIAAGLVVGRSREAPVSSRGEMVPECGGAIRSVVVQYVAGADFVEPVYRAVLGDLPAGVRVYVVCPEQADFEAFEAGVGTLRAQVMPVLVHHVMTPWARDRWMAVRGAAGLRIVAPQGERGAEAWPARAGDAAIAADLGQTLPGLKAERSALYFDGGDFLADAGVVFVTRAVVERNLGQTVTSREALLHGVRELFSQRPVLVEEGPDHHAGMFMMAAGEGRMVVGDPSLGRALFDAAGPEAAALEGGADFSPQAQARFDAVARAAEAAGFRVTRMPVVVPAIGKNYLTFVNVVMDERAGERIVYMPAFAGQGRLTAAAAQVWASLGYRVAPVDCSGVWTKGGTVHCLVNVLERG
jgi:hypothetical protein